MTQREYIPDHERRWFENYLADPASAFAISPANATATTRADDGEPTAPTSTSLIPFVRVITQGVNATATGTANTAPEVRNFAAGTFPVDAAGTVGCYISVNNPNNGAYKSYAIVEDGTADPDLDQIDAGTDDDDFRNKIAAKITADAYYLGITAANTGDVEITAITAGTAGNDIDVDSNDPNVSAGSTNNTGTDNFTYINQQPIEYVNDGETGINISGVESATPGLADRLNRDLFFYGALDGKPSHKFYDKLDDDPDVSGVRWIASGGGKWRISYADETWFESTEDVATADLVTSWTLVYGGATAGPRVTPITTECERGSDAGTGVTALESYINANSETLGVSAVADAGAGTIAITAINKGVDGNGILLSSDNPEFSWDDDMAGGVDWEVEDGVTDLAAIAGSFGINLAGHAFSSLDLSYHNFMGANLAGANFTSRTGSIGVNFKYADLTGAAF